MANNVFSSIRRFYSKKSLIIIPCFLFILAFATYINILPNKLFFDDEELIYKNAYVADLKYLPEYFTENMVAGAGKMSNMYRPVLLISFAADHLLWGNNPFGYHLTSILLHGTNGVLVFFLVYLLFRNKLVGAITSILFIVHPVQSEAVSYASGRTDPLYSFFALLSIILFLLFLKAAKKHTLYYAGSLILLFFSLLSKETAIVMPFILVLIYFVTAKTIGWNRKKFILSIQPFFLISFVYLILRLTILNFSNTLNFYTEANAYSQNIIIRIYTFSVVFFEYLLILFFPKDLIIARIVPIVTSPFSPYVIAFAVFIFFLFFLSVILWRKNRLFLFSCLWFFITIAPVSGIIPINNIITEHYLYLPSLSFFLLFGSMFAFLWKSFQKTGFKYAIIAIFILILGLLFYRTLLRTYDWRDPITFYTLSLKQSPWHIPMKHNLAMAYSEEGKTGLAITQYLDIIKIGDYYPQTHHNLANSYKSIGEYKEAEEEYIKAIKMNQKFLFSYYGLLDLYKITGEKTKYDEVMKVINEINK